jgi:hypothetical protein
MNILEFILFFLFIFFIGRGIFILIFNKQKNPIFSDLSQLIGLPQYYFYPIISMFFLGNFFVIFNFLLPGDQITIFILIISIYLIYVNIVNRLYLDLRKSNIYVYFFILIVLGVSSYGSWLHYDAGMYHLGNQAWINNSKIVFGLGNLNIWYSWSSIYEYLSAFVTRSDNYIFLHYLNLIFVSMLFHFLLISTTSKASLIYKNCSILIILYGLLDNFGISGGNNGFITLQALGKVDIAFGILLFLLFMMIYSLIQSKSYKVSEFLIITLMQIFLVQLKTTGYFLLPLYFYYVYKFRINDRNNLIQSFKKSLPLAALGIFWYLKNLIVSGCIVFPIEATCFSNFSWYEKYTAKGISSWGGSIDRVYRFDESFIEWFPVWFELDHNKQVLPNYVGSLLILFLFKKLFFTKKQDFNKKIFLFFLTIIIFSWLTTGAVFRYGFGIWLLIVSYFSLDMGILKSSYGKKSNYLITVLLISCCLMFPRIYSYKEFIEMNFSYYSVELEENTYTKKVNSWGVKPLETDRNLCWSEIECIENEKHNISLKYRNGYKIFTKDR